MVLADELEADWARVHVEQAPGDDNATGTKTPTARGAFAASCTRFARRGPPRARCWSKLPRSSGTSRSPRCARNQHQVIHTGSGRTIDYAISCHGAHTRRPGEGTAAAQEPSEFRYLGTNVPIVDLHGHDGRTRALWHRSDPGRHQVRRHRSATGLWGRLRRIDDRARPRVHGVERIVRIPSTARPPACRRLAESPSSREHLGGDQGVSSTGAHLARRPARLVQQRVIPNGAGACSPLGGQGRSNPGQRGRRARACRRNGSALSTTSPTWRTPPWSRPRRWRR